MLYLVDKQIYKLKLSKKWKIYIIFHILLLKQDISKKIKVNNSQLKYMADNA